MGDEERVKLRTLLNYWVEHNMEHSQEFREWHLAKLKPVKSCCRRLKR